MVEVAKAHTDKQTKFGLVYEAMSLYFHAPWVFGLGAEVLDADGNVHIDSPAGVKALELARDLVKTHGVVPATVTAGMVSGYFNDGSAAMAISGPWMRGEIEGTGVDFGVAVLPDIEPGKPARPFLGVEAVFLNHKSPNKEAALEVIEK